MSWRAFMSRNVAEFRVIACPTSAGSAAVRSYFEKNYQTIKTLNPRLPFLIREGPNMPPYVIARYDWGHKEEVSLANLSEAEIDKVFERLTKSGETMDRSPESLEPVRLPTIVD